jgi:hypothetical protein
MHSHPEEVPMNAGQTAPTRGSMVRMSIRAGAVSALLLGLIATGVTSAEAKRPQHPGCKVLSVVSTTQTYPGMPSPRSGIPASDTAHVTETVTTSRCRGKLVTTTTYTTTYTPGPSSRV